MNEDSIRLSFIEHIKKRIKKRSPTVIGGSVGAAIGSLGGPGFAVLGAGVGGVIAEEVEDFLQRNLSEKEKERLIIAFDYAIKKYNERIEAGFEPLDDDFINDSLLSRSSAKEIVEGIYISAKTDHEERKLPYYGYIMANILFEPKIDRYQANTLLRFFEDLSYRQLCILSIIAHKDEFGLRKASYGNEKDLDYKLVSLLQEIRDLCSKELINTSDDSIDWLNFKTNSSSIIPANLIFQLTGEVIYILAELKDLYRKHHDELRQIAELLQ